MAVSDRSQRSDDVPPRRPRKRIWVQHVAVETDKLRFRLDAARAGGQFDQRQEAIADGVYAFVDKARYAAFREDPLPGKWANWWRGTLVEAAYRNLHAARVQLFDLYDENQLRAEIPIVVARANATLQREDPRRVTVQDLEAETFPARRARVRRLAADSYEQLDLEHAQLRSFRNILLLVAFFVMALLAATLVVVGRAPNVLPLCFQFQPVDGEVAANGLLNCPTGRRVTQASGGDVLIVALLGALGGALTAALSIRNLKGTSTPYDVPVALAFLKVPLGAMTAILALVAIQGKFVPGLSVLDSQGQILAYALIFGFAQQALSRLLDKQAQNLLEGLPGGENVQPQPPGPGRLQPEATTQEPAVVVLPEQRAPATPPSGTPPSPPVAADGAAPPAPAAEAPAAEGEGDRPVDEPEGATQAQQYALLRDTGNERQDMDEHEEAQLLQDEFGRPDAQGIYRGPGGAV